MRQQPKVGDKVRRVRRAYYGRFMMQDNPFTYGWEFHWYTVIALPPEYAEMQRGKHYKGIILSVFIWFPFRVYRRPS